MPSSATSAPTASHESGRAGDPGRAFGAVALLLGVAAVLFAVGILVGFVVVGRHGGGPIQGWDDTVNRWYVDHRGPLVGVSKFIATWLDALPLGILCVALSLVLGWLWRTPRALIPAVAYFGGEFQVFVIRAVILRHRPPTADYPAPGAVPGVHETSYSFPSGHSVAVTAVLVGLLGCLALTRHTWWPWIVALVGSLFVVDTRLVLGVHWFSDVVLGLLLGIAWGVTVAVAARRVEWADCRAALRWRPGRSSV